MALAFRRTPEMPRLPGAGRAPVMSQVSAPRRNFDPRAASSPGPTGGPLSYQAKANPLASASSVSAPLSAPLQAGVSNIQHELGSSALAQRDPRFKHLLTNLPKLLHPNETYLHRDASGRVLSSPRIALNAQAPRALGATEAGALVMPHEVDIGAGTYGYDRPWVDQWLEKGFCSKSNPQACETFKNLKRFYNRPYEKLLAGIPLPRLAQKHLPRFVSDKERDQRLRRYYEGRYDLDQPSMSREDYLADVNKKGLMNGPEQGGPTLERLKQMEYNLRMSQRAKQAGWPTGKMPIDPSFYAHTEANRRAIYDQAPKTKDYLDFLDENAEPDWHHLRMLLPIIGLFWEGEADGTAIYQAWKDYREQFSAPEYDFWNKRKWLYEHPGWLAQHPEQKEDYMIGFLGNRVPDSGWLKLWHGLENLGLGLGHAVAEPVKAIEGLGKQLFSLSDTAIEECNGPGVDTQKCAALHQVAQIFGMDAAADADWASGSPLDSEIRATPTLNRGLDIAGQSALLGAAVVGGVAGVGGKAAGTAARAGELAEASAAASRAGTLGRAGELAEASSMAARAGEMAETSSTAARAGELAEGSLGEQTLPKRLLSEPEVSSMAARAGELVEGSSTAARAGELAEGSLGEQTLPKRLLNDEALQAHKTRLQEMGRWNDQFGVEENLAREKEIEGFTPSEDELRRWHERSDDPAQPPTYFSNLRFANPSYRNLFDESLLSKQADTLLSDTPQGHAARMNDQLQIMKWAKKSPAQRFAMSDGGYTSAEMAEAERKALDIARWEYAEALKSYRPQARLPAAPRASLPKRVISQARWTKQRLLDQGLAKGLPEATEQDRWLGAFTNTDPTTDPEQLNHWLDAQPGAREFYNKYFGPFGSDPVPWKGWYGPTGPNANAHAFTEASEASQAAELSKAPKKGPSAVAPEREQAAFLADPDELRREMERPGFQERQPSYFAHHRFGLPEYQAGFDQDLIKQQADTLLSDTEAGRAMRRSDQRYMARMAKKSPPERYVLDQAIKASGNAKELGSAQAQETLGMNTEWRRYVEALKSYRPQARLPAYPKTPRLTRLLDEIRWTKQRALGQDLAAGAPNSGALDRWLGPFARGEPESSGALAQWLDEVPGAKKFYDRYGEMPPNPNRQVPWKGWHGPHAVPEASQAAELSQVPKLPPPEPPPVPEASQTANLSQVPKLPPPEPPPVPEIGEPRRMPEFKEPETTALPLESGEDLARSAAARQATEEITQYLKNRGGPSGAETVDLSQAPKLEAAKPKLPVPREPGEDLTRSASDQTLARGSFGRGPIKRRPSGARRVTAPPVSAPAVAKPPSLLTTMPSEGTSVEALERMVSNEQLNLDSAQLVKNAQMSEVEKANYRSRGYTATEINNEQRARTDRAMSEYMTRRKALEARIQAIKTTNPKRHIQQLAAASEAVDKESLLSATRKFQRPALAESAPSPVDWDPALERPSQASSPPPVTSKPTEISRLPSPLLTRMPPEGTSLETLERMLTPEQENIDLAHLTEHPQMSEAEKAVYRNRGYGESAIKNAEQERNKVAIDNYKARQKMLRERVAAMKRRSSFRRFIPNFGPPGKSRIDLSKIIRDLDKEPRP